MINPYTYLKSYIRKTIALVELEARKLWHDPLEVVLRSLQPALWLVVFGQVMSPMHPFHHGHLSYLDFLAPGILAQSVLFIAIFNGISVIWERDMGISHKLLVAPIPRSAIILGKGIGSGIRATSQLIIIYCLALFLNIKINLSLGALLSVWGFVLLGALLFSTFSLIIACMVKTRERFMGIGQLMTMPLFFMSNAVYPVEAMPHWLQIVAHLNPLTYEIDALRAVMIEGGTSLYGLGFDLAYMGLLSFILIAVGVRAYPRLGQ